MMKSIYRHALFALAIAALPAAALAEDAFTLQGTDIYAGPSSDYPQIATLPPNTEVGVAGCLSDWSWCDVTFANDRGWVWAGDLGAPYQSGRVAIIEYGPRLRLPVVTFNINTYWDSHYRSRPFFRERNVWVSRVHVEGGHGGTPPHGGTRVARPEGGAQPAPSARAGQAQQPRTAQGTERQREEAAQRQPEQRSREQAAQKTQTDQRARQEAQRAQPNQPQAHNAQRPEEAAKSREARPQPEASRTQPEQRAQMNQRPQANDQHAQATEQGRSTPSQERAGQREGRPTQSAQSEATRPQPDRGANAKGPQNETSRGQPDRGANAKGPQEEKKKEERREGSQQ